MSDMERSTGEVVKEMIERDGSIKIGLARGLINARALARYIQEATHERYTFEALLSAIRRYPVKESTGRRVVVGKAIRKVSLKNKISVILIRNRPELQPILAGFAGELDHAGGDTFRMVATARVVKVEIDSKNVDGLTAKLQRREVLNRMDNLAEILVETSDVLFTPGVLAVIDTELAMNGVNILEHSTLYELSKAGGEQRQTKFLSQDIYIVDERDATKAYEALQRLSNEK